MRFIDLLKKWDLKNYLLEEWDFGIEPSTLERPLQPSESDKDAFWELHTELVVFIIQTLDNNAAGMEMDPDAEGIYEQHLIDQTNLLCVRTGELLKKHGRSKGLTKNPRRDSPSQRGPRVHSYTDGGVPFV